MSKAISFIFLGFLSLLVAVPLYIPVVAQAEDGMASNMDGMRKKRYRYRKRTHRIQVGANIMPWNTDSDKNMFVDADLLYGYNAGHFEIGPNLGITFEDKKLQTFEGGLWGEFNIIKNTRKERFVPAIGLKANYMKMGRDNNLLLSLYLALKYFPASRTGLVLNVGYEVVDEFNELFKFKNMGLPISLSYVHYFHF